MTTYTLLLEPSVPLAAPVLDTSQQAVVAHAGGPLLVLAGPGTGKTTTLVEAVVGLVEHRGVRPEEVLALTFSRKAAEQLRDRVTSRLGRTVGASMAATFHSFAYSLVRQYADEAAFTAPLRLLSAPVQDVVLQTLLRPSPEAVTWPHGLAEAVRTRGFSREVQTLLGRARERGVSASRLAELGVAAGRPEWVAAGHFLEQYLDVLDAEAAVDYADLMVRAVRLAEQPEVQTALRRRYSWVFVDEYQDTDPSQVALLQALAGGGRNLVVVGDPDQSIYAFRGAEVRGILDFPDRFRTRQGDRAPVVALRTTRRFGPALLRASRRIATSIPTAGAIPAEVVQAFRDPDSVEGEFGAGEVEVLHLDSSRAEVEHIADRLRRAALEDEIPWSDMAVLVRSGRASIPSLRRALSVAGVPVEVASDDTPLTTEPAVVPLLDALKVVVALGREDPEDPLALDDDRAASLLTSPLGGLDAAEVRVLARALYQREKVAATTAQRPVRPSAELVREALVRPERLEALQPGRAVDKARRLARLLERARAQLQAEGSAEEVLWTLWSGTRWPERLRTSATSGGPGAAAAHRDLDALCALFEEAAKVEEQRGHTSVASFLQTLLAQELPADTLADRGVRGEAVRLLTAHRSKGLEWRFAVVAQVQEGRWPDLRRRASLLRADELGVDGVLPPVETRALLAEERRLFYVACTRARQRLLVTAVASPEDDGEQPSRFTAELAEPQLLSGRPERPLSLPGLVAELRRTAGDGGSPPALRAAAAQRLARLALERRGAAALVPTADPASWWGLRSRSEPSRPLRSPDEPVTISASTLEALLGCPAKWFLEHEAGGATCSTTAQGFGKLVHGLADQVARGAFDGEVTEEQLMTAVDRVWGLLQFRTPWSSTRDRGDVQAALHRFLTWHRSNHRTVLDTEMELEAELEVDGERVRLRGYADRLELDTEGRVVVVDFKTSKNPPTEAKVAAHPQLALYQLAVANGAVDAALGRPGRPGGAELVQLRVKGETAKVQPQAPLEPDTEARSVIEGQVAEVVRRIRAEDFPVVEGHYCDHCDFHALCPLKTSGTVLS